MPPLSSTSNKPVAAEKKIRRKRKVSVTYPGPTKARKKVRVRARPAPVHQPGPFTDAEHRKVERNRKTKKYQKAIQKARVHGPATRRGHGPGEAKGDAEFKKGQDYVRKQYVASHDRYADYVKGTTVPPDIRSKQQKRTLVDSTKKSNAAMGAPVLKALEQTTRPIHAIAAAERSLIKSAKGGQLSIHKPKALTDAAKAAGRGLANKDKSTTRDVLKDVGVKNKAVLAVGGFAGDVFGDPTTYVTFGAGSIAKKAALDAAKRAESKALKAGLTKEQATRMGERAAKQTERKASQAKGATVSFAGKEIPGVRRVTAKAATPVRKVKNRAARSKVGRGSRSVAADVNPNIAPVGVSRHVSDRAIQATRTARAKSNQGQRAAVNLSQAIRKRIGEDNYQRVVDAIEAGTVKDLPPELRDAAKRLADRFKHIRRVQRHAGVSVADAAKSPAIKGYVPRKIVETVEEAGKGKPGVGRRVIKPGSSKARTEKRRLADVRDEKPGVYREDLHAIAAERMSEGATSAARGGLNRTLADLGTPVRRGHDISLAENEAVFHIKGSDIREVTDPKEPGKINQPLTLSKNGKKLKGANKKGGRYVVLNKDVVKRALEGSSPTLQGPGIVHGLDKATAGFKRIAIATPGFHLRNLAGDLQNAYLGQSAHRLPGNMRRAAKVLRAHGASERAIRDLAPEEVGHATLKTKRYGNVTYNDVAKELAQRGAFDSGYIGGELRELSKSGGLSSNRVATALRKGRARVGQTRPVRGVKGAALARENLPRLTTAMEALRRGATWDEASQAVAGLHFDYQHLTNFERQIARRAMPFYTWSARNIPLQTRKFVTKPGKYANYQKLRENAAAAVGADDVDAKTKDMYRKLEQAGVKLPGGWEKYLTEWEQRNAGVPVSWGGQKFTISLGLPLQDLNEAPGAAGLHQLNEYYQKGMSLTGPIPKDVVEYFENHSFFFRDEIERQHSPLVAAPGYVAGLPAGLRGKLGVTKMVDKQSGKMVWGWPGKMDYLAKAIPGTPNYAQQLLTGGADRRGKSTTGKVLGYLGVKAVPVDATRNAVNMAYARMDEITRRKAALNQEGFNAGHPNREYTTLLAQEKILRTLVYQGKASQGYKVLPKQGGPSKVRVSRPKSSGSGGGLFDGGSSSSSSSSSGLLDPGSSSSSSSSSGGGLFD